MWMRGVAILHPGVDEGKGGGGIRRPAAARSQGAAVPHDWPRHRPIDPHSASARERLCDDLRMWVANVGGEEFAIGSSV